MKRILKIILPLLLIAVVVCGAAWYIFVYRDFLNDTYYMNRAEAALEDADYEDAIELYQKALNRNSGDPEIHIALADAYALSGNYTRAEYTLACAIMELPEETSLYVALSRIYVEQDKLLDAENLLSSVTYESVYEELNAMRPAAPVFDQPAGTYTDYITLSISSSGGTCYVSLGGEYPSVNDEPCTGSVDLPAGRTQVQAIVVDENGLVSTLTSGSYLIGHVDEEVTFADAVLEAEIREMLGLDSSAVIMSSDLWEITTLTIPEGVNTLEDLQWFEELETLTISGFSEPDLSPLTELVSLRTLYLTGTALDAAGTAAIGSMTWLTQLYMSGCGLSSVSFLEELNSLQVLDLSDNSLGSVAALAGMTDLRALNLADNVLDSIEDLAALTNLQELILSGNLLTDITPLRRLTALQVLDISDNSITSLEILFALSKLTDLDASGNELYSVEDLSVCTSLVTLDLSDNHLYSIEDLKNLTTLQELILDYNSLTSLPDFNDDCALVYISAEHNRLVNVSGLSDLQWLNYVDVDYNSISSLDALADCINLVQVNAFENPLTDVSALTAHGIIVNYSPDYTASTEEDAEEETDTASEDAESEDTEEAAETAEAEESSTETASEADSETADTAGSSAETESAE